MKLYFSPGACSLAPHIVLREAGVDFTPVQVSTKTHTLGDGTDFYTINPKGYVPALQLDSGALLTEGSVISQYVADLVPESKLLAGHAQWERYQTLEWLNFIGTELHKGFSPLFNPAMPDEAKAVSRAKLGERLAWVNTQLEGRSYLRGDTFTIADAYLFTVVGWSRLVAVDISGLSYLGAFIERVRARPAVQAALKAEGLLR